MFYLVQEWMTLLRGLDAVVGIPLCLAGGALVYAGWRLWPAVALASFGVVGGVIGQSLSGDLAFNAAWFGGGAAVLMIGGFLLSQFASVVLAGIIGGAITAMILEVFRMTGPFMWLGAFLGFAGCGSWAFANRNRVIALVTSFEGGALFISGMSIMVREVSWLHSFFRSMTSESPFMIGFFLLVPTAVGVLIQAADANRSSAKSAQ
ncbi:MAG: hypothetical protein DHS20C16_28000 [Phycisphaerae bacterium]|nr:MAG: hypothetical protein DHS20C16_28000 [Phycisphaerae bacterium]